MHAESNGLMLNLYLSSRVWEPTGLYIYNLPEEEEETGYSRGTQRPIGGMKEDHTRQIRLCRNEIMP
jgi:hypothetical protein